MWRFLFLFVTLFVIFLITLITFVGIKVEKIKATIGNVNFGIYNLLWKGFNIKVGSLTIDIKPTKDYISEKVSLNGKEIRKNLILFAKIFSEFPFKFYVKDTYIKNGNFSINLYSFSIQKNQIKLQYLEVLNNSAQTLTSVENLKIHGNFHTYFGNTNYQISNLKGELDTRINPQKGEIQLNNYLRGLNAFFSAKVVFDKKIKTSLNGDFKNFQFTYEGSLWKDKIYGKGGLNNHLLQAKLKVFGTINSPKVGFLGNIHLCSNSNLTFGGLISNSYLFFGINDLNNSLYAEGFLNLKTLKGKLLASSPKGGSITANFSPIKVQLLAKRVNINNLCGLNISNLNLFAFFYKRTYSVEGFWKSLSYKNLSIKEEKFNVEGKNKVLKIRLEGSAEGTLISKRKYLWGYLRGNLFINQNPLNFNFPLLEAKLSKRGKFLIYLLKLTFKDIQLRDIKSKILTNQQGVFINFSNNWKGKIKIFPIKKEFNAKLNGSFQVNERKIPFYVDTKLTPIKGFWQIKILKNSLSGGYKKFSNIWKGNYVLKNNYTSILGRFSFEKKFLKTEGLLNFKDINSFIFFVIPYSGTFKGQKFSFLGYPSCIFYVNFPLICFKQILLKGNSLKNIEWNIQTFNNTGQIKLTTFGNLKDNNIVFSLKTSIKRDLLNIFLKKFKTVITQPKYLNFSFSYKGTLDKFLENLNWSYSEELTLYSYYFYKPLKVYISLFANRKKIDTFIGLLDLFTQTPLGNIQVSYPFGAQLSGSFNFVSIPLRFFYKDALNSYLNLDLNGNFTYKRKLFLNVNTGIGGYIKVNKYEFPKSEENNGNRKLPISLNLNLYSSSPVYIQTPNGNFVITFEGFIKNNLKKLDISINYGKLNILGKTFYVNLGKISVRGEKVYLNLPLVYYAPDKTVYLKIYGYLPWQNLKFDIYSVPPAPKEELLMELISGSGAGSSILSTIGESPLTSILLKGISTEATNIVNRISSQFLEGINISLAPYFEPNEGLVVGITVEKFFGNTALIGYHWVPSTDPKATYLWGSVRFLFNSFLRFVRYSDGTISTNVRFLNDFGLPH